jgi:hypothetical protein
MQGKNQMFQLAPAGLLWSVADAQSMNSKAGLSHSEQPWNFHILAFGDQ